MQQVSEKCEWMFDLGDCETGRKVQELIDTEIEEIRSDTVPTEPLVSVWLITYNHRSYIEQAIESVLEQETDFPFEIVIGDDFSTDGTREIVLNYQRKYPDRIRLILAKRNLWNPFPEMPGTVTAMELYQTCGRAPFMALLEGDDYWCDQTKLQRQIDVLQNDDSVALVFHSWKVDRPGISPKLDQKLWKDRQRMDFSTVLQYWCIRTCSMVFRTPAGLPGWFCEVHGGDKFLAYLLLTKGDAIYLDRPMCVYRVHDGNITAAVNNSGRDQAYEHRVNRYSAGLKRLDGATVGKYSSTIRRAERLHRYARAVKRSASLGGRVWFQLCFLINMTSHHWLWMAHKAVDRFRRGNRET
tara:strand:- start:13000 stop:14064 length:1065 start_codon:yes stop_codon:yes gene_type:complete